MLRYSFMFVMACCVFPAIDSALADGPSTAPATKNSLAASLEKFDSVQNATSYGLEARIIYDLARLPLLYVANPRNNDWVIARIIPDPRAMLVEHPEMEINEDGIDLTPAGLDKELGHSYTIYGGTVEIHEALGKSASVGRFEESIPSFATQSPPGHKGDAFSLYDVFEPPGALVVCIVNDIFPGRSRYAPALAIPPKWEGLLREAATKIPADADALRFEDGPGRDQARARLTGMVRSPNPFVAIAAFRVLSNADALGKEDDACKMIIAAPDPLQQGALALLFLRQRPLATEDVDRRHWDDNFVRREQRVAALANAVSEAESFHSIRGIALAAYVRLMTPPSYDTIWNGGRPLLVALRDKAAHSGPLSREDQELIKAIEDRTMPEPEKK